ncbi:MAG: glycogen/starch/alpha-glucan phosphorylase [Thaumarchaeota archaeon]|nr:glycogen/starch/alpha-glucan phosphorylase [Nitrososphaerota archaeon]MCL5317395.1 glycogen/starch/alpha-glucan phosphorylase [Nitrososphaerota archaeon]
MIISVTPELALDEGYTYAGGLGVLEGDKFYCAAKLGIPYKTFTLFYREGYVDYEFDERGNPRAKPQTQPAEFLKKLSREQDTLSIRLRGEEVKTEILKYKVGNAEAVFFRITEPQWAAKLLNRVYLWENEEDKFLTYAFLAKATAEYIKNYVGVAHVDYLDLQEAYACILPLELKIPGKYRVVVHTAGSWGHPSFPRSYFEREFGYKFISHEVSLTEIGLSTAREAFTVSAKHYDVMSNVIPHHMDKLRYITNGIEIDRWMNPDLKAAFEKGNLTTDLLANVKATNKKRFIKFLKQYKDVDIGDRPIVTWSRRIVPYKRPEFVLKAINEIPSDQVFFVLGGKVHPQDMSGLEYMKAFRRMHQEHENVVYVPNYDVTAAKQVLTAADLLLFTPFSGWEACGTSYMKSGVNGVPILSSHDGGAVELIVDGVNSWFFGRKLKGLVELGGKTADDINAYDYTDFKKQLVNIISMYRNNPEKYYKVALNAVTTFTLRVDMQRTLREYYPDIVKIRHQAM